MDRVTSGSFRMEGQEITTLKERELIRYRREKIGFVFQFYNLIQNLTALEKTILAFVVMCNLAAININERQRELATLKVLGFYNKEVDNYINSDRVAGVQKTSEVC